MGLGLGLDELESCNGPQWIVRNDVLGQCAGVL
jgi:hypothetical protein